MRIAAESNCKRSPAEVYDELFVPALFRPWAERLAELAAVAPGDVVLDVGCGTGVLALAAAARAGADGAVVGLDPDPGMLAVARRRCAPVAWREGRAEELPWEDSRFDAVLSQFAFMFFDDHVAALREMARVLRPRGRLAVAVCDAVDHSPGYAVLCELLHRLFGCAVAEAFRAPFELGDRSRLRAFAAGAGLEHATVTRLDGMLRFASIAALVAAERACAWTLGGLLDDDEFARLSAAAEESLAPFVVAGGRVEFAMPVLCLTAGLGASY